MWRQDHLTTLTYHNKYIILMLYKIIQSFADKPLHAVPQALAIASELAILLRRWSNIDNWHAECVVNTSDIIFFIIITNEPPREKTNNLDMRKQRRRSASRKVTAKLISAFVFASQIVHFLFFLNPKFQASRLLL